MNLYSYKNTFANVYANEYCFYMILASCFKRTQCISCNAENQLKLYYADLVRDNSGYDRHTGQWKSSYSYARQLRMEDMYIPVIENGLVKALADGGWDISDDQAEVYIQPSMKVVLKQDAHGAAGRTSKKNSSKGKVSYAVYGHIFRFTGLYNELLFQIVEENRTCRVTVTVRKPGQKGIVYHLTVRESRTA